MTQSPFLPELPKPTKVFGPLGYREVFFEDDIKTHGLACYEAGRASRAQSEPAVPQKDADEVYAAMSKRDPNWNAYGKSREGAVALALSVVNEMLAAAPTQGAEGAAPQAVVGEASDEEFGIGDEVILTRAVSVMNDVLTDISGWEDRELAEAVESSKVDLCAMIECIRMRADGSYVPGTKPIDGEVFTPSPTPTAPQAADALREALESALSICNETRQARDLQPRMTEIRAIARAALAQHQPATLGETK